MFSFFKKKPAHPQVEFSTDLSPDHVGPYLERVARLLDSGLGKSDRKRILSDLPGQTDVPGGDFEFRVCFQGQDSMLKIVMIIPDDPGTVRLYFLAAPPLHAAIREMHHRAKETGP